jgi:corrinoid protein of di/trimethylamine methyltransferase
MVNDEIFEQLAQAVINYNSDAALQLSKEAIEKGVSPIDAIQKGLNKGMKTIGDQFSRAEAPLPIVILAARAMSTAIEYLKTQMKQGETIKPTGKYLLGVVEGDIHDIGAKILIPILEIAGFEVKYAGIDVPIETFIKEAESFHPDIIGLSSFMTTTMIEQEKLIKELKKRGLRNKYKIMIGGGPISEEWKDRINADGYAPDAPQTVEVAKQLLAN